MKLYDEFRNRKTEGKKCFHPYFQLLCPLVSSNVFIYSPLLFCSMKRSWREKSINFVLDS